MSQGITKEAEKGSDDEVTNLRNAGFFAPNSVTRHRMVHCRSAILFRRRNRHGNSLTASAKNDNDFCESSFLSTSTGAEKAPAASQTVASTGWDEEVAPTRGALMTFVRGNKPGSPTRRSPSDSRLPECWEDRGQAPSTKHVSAAWKVGHQHSLPQSTYQCRQPRRCLHLGFPHQDS